jgi:hypothetical protein
MDFWLSYQEVDHDLKQFVEIYERFRSSHDVQGLVIGYTRFATLVEKIQTMMSMGLQETIIKKLLWLDVEPAIVNELLKTKTQWWREDHSLKGTPTLMTA